MKNSGDIKKPAALQALAPDLILDLQLATALSTVPSQPQFEQWLHAALREECCNKDEIELTIRIVDETEGQMLNRDYRGKDYPTNVLSFPADLPEEVDIPLLGDLVICAPVIAREANEQNKTLDAHWAHMVIHGTLHLLGYDHMTEEEAEVMEALETKILHKLGYADPYLEN
jgi:probable rRNA maturation factor